MLETAISLSESGMGKFSRFSCRHWIVDCLDGITPPPSARQQAYSQVCGRGSHLAAIRSGSSSSTAIRRDREGFFAFVSTTFGFTDARSKIGLRYCPVADTGTPAIV